LQVGAPQVSAPQVGIMQLGGSQVGVLQVGALQVGATQVGAEQVGLSQVGAAEAGPPQVGPLQVGVLQVRELQVHALKVADSRAVASYEFLARQLLPLLGHVDKIARAGIRDQPCDRVRVEIRAMCYQRHLGRPRSYPRYSGTPPLHAMEDTRAVCDTVRSVCIAMHCIKRVQFHD
jgi:hypothetical protein